MDVLWLLLAYVFGACSSALVYCRMKGLGDPRDEGSGNPGATNIYRLHGKTAAMWVFLGDGLKGHIPVIAAMLSEHAHLAPWLGLAALIGHIFPVFFRWQGGRGIATGFGALLAWQPMIAAGAMALWLVIFRLTRISSLSALAALLCTEILSIWLLPPWQLLPLTFMVLLIVYRHTDNFKRLWQREEKPI